MERTFDRLVSFDSRSRNFPARTLVSQELPPRSYTWSCSQVLDQGADGACVGFGWSGELLARPAVVAGINNDQASRLYKAAQRVDEWEGEDYEGTSVLAGAKVVQTAGFMQEYRWAFDLPEVLRTIGYHGPVVTGFMWKSGMMQPDSNGWIHYTGDDVGGHCTLWRAVNVTHHGLLVHNSWGSGWGQNGTAHMSWDDFGLAMENQGEVCVPVGRDKVGTLP